MHTRDVFTAALLSCLLCVAVQAGTKTWRGETSDNWSDGGNWTGGAPVAGDDLVFPAAAQRLDTTNNDFAVGTSFNSITIQAGGYTLNGGNNLILAGGAAALQTTNASGSNSINFPLEFDVSSTISVAAGGTLLINGAINAPAAVVLTKGGDGVLDLTVANTNFQGTTMVNGGIVYLTNAQGLGSGQITINTGGTLTSRQSPVTNSIVLMGGTLAGSVAPNGSALGQLQYGNVEVAAGFISTIMLFDPLTLTPIDMGLCSNPSVFSGTGTVNVVGVPTALTHGFGGGASNGETLNFCNNINPFSGTVNIGPNVGFRTLEGGANHAPFGSGSDPATFNINGGGNLNLNDDASTVYNGNVVVQGDAEIDTSDNGGNTLIGTHTLHTLSIGAQTLTMEFFKGDVPGYNWTLKFDQATTLTGNATFNTLRTNLTLAGPVGNGGSGFGFTKTGRKQMLLSAANTYTGATIVNQGLLLVNGSLASGAGPVTVNATGTLGGMGSVQAIKVLDGTVSPGDPAFNGGFGILSGASADFSSGTSSTLALQIRSFATPGDGYDRLALSGALTLGGASALTVDMAGISTTGTVAGVVTFLTRTGTFTTVNFVNNFSGLGHTVVYKTNAIDIVFTNPPTQVRVETAPDGSGMVVPDTILFLGDSITLYAVARDANGNFVDNVAASWVFSSASGGIAGGDLAVNADGKSAVFTGHNSGTVTLQAQVGGLTAVDSGTITVEASSKLFIETAADGLGTLVQSQTLTSGQTLTVYAILRDVNNQFIANVPPDSWTLTATSGGVLPGDLLASGDGKSATFTAALVGSAVIHATSSVYPVVDSGVITVIAGAAANVSVELAPDGSGSIAPGANFGFKSGESLTFFAISRDAAGNFIANVAATWSLAGKTGGVADGDLTATGGGQSAAFTAKLTGSAEIHVTSAGLSPVNLVLVTVTAGDAAVVRVETKADGTGVLAPEQTLSNGASLTVFAITRDAAGNFIANVAADGWQLVNQTGAGDSSLTINSGNMSAVFTAGAAAGSANIRTTSGTLSASDSGKISVVASVAQVRVETAADGNGSVLSDTPLAAGQSLTVFAIARDGTGGFVANVSANWSLATTGGGVAAGDLVPSNDRMSAIFTGHKAGTATIDAASGIASSVDSGVITVLAGAATQVSVETQADGLGSLVSSQPLASGSSLTVFAISRDAGGNFVANVAANWSLLNISGGVVNGDLAASGAVKSAVFTGHVAGSAQLHADSGGLTPGDSGTITVTSGNPFQVRVETKADGSGTLVPDQNVASGNSVTVFAVARDASGNFTGSVAASWSLANKTGGVGNGDLTVIGAGQSAVFTGHVAGSAQIHSASGLLTPVDSGTLTVTAGAPAQVRVETAANGGGTVVPAQNLASGSTLTVYSILRDAQGNFVANAPADLWSLVNKSGGVADSNLVVSADGKSAVFTGVLVGTVEIHARSGLLTQGQSGTITVIAGPPSQVRVETTANGLGTVVPAQTVFTGNSLTVFAITRDAAGNFVDNVAASWSLQNITGAVAAGDLVPSVVDSKSAVFTANGSGSAQIQAVSGAFPPGLSGTISVDSKPVITSPPTANPTVAGTGQPVTFNAAAMDADAGDHLTFTWTFDDGTTVVDGPSVTHAFTTPGAHTATVTVDDGHGGTATANIEETVNSAIYVTGNPDDKGFDVDGDGFSDKFEAAINAALPNSTDPNDGAKTPFDKNGKATPPLPLSILSLSIKLNFVSLLKDSIQLKGSLPLAAAALPLTGHRVIVDVGGYIAAYTLDIKGKSPKSKTSSFTLGAKPSKKTGLSKFTFKVSQSTVAPLFADDGLTTTTAPKSLVNIPVTLIFNDAGYQKIQHQHYTQSKGRTGRTSK